MLGHDWKVRNFGVSGRTMLKHGDYPYWKEKAFQQAQAFEPKVVIVMLGTNDTKPWNWKHKEQFARDYKEMVEKFKDLQSKPRVFVCLPLPVPGKGNFGINEAGVQEEIPLIKEVAKETGAGIINMHATLEKTPELLPDRVHPNAEGYKRMAAAVYHVLTGKRADQEAAKR
jgi:lysophospholipase L1-like esterase